MTDRHNANVAHMVDGNGSNGRYGFRYSFSPRKAVQHWSNRDGSGDLWVTDNLLTEEVRKTIESVASINDSPYKKSEKLVILKDDTKDNRVALFKQIVKMCGGQF